MKSPVIYWPYLSLAGMVLCLVWLGIVWVDVPPIYRLTHSPFVLYRGYVAFGLAALLFCFHQQVTHGLIWISMQVQRWLSALAMLAVVWAEATMHLFNIPHMEGWWVPLLGGGFISGVVGWVKGYRTRIKHKLL